MFFLALLSLVRVTSAADVLALGDSWAKHSLTYLADNCAGKTVHNGGVDKSTAVQWAAGLCAAPAGPPSACNAQTAFQGVHGVKSVWFSVGGNDFLQSGCQLTAAQMAKKVARALIALRAAAPTVNIVMTGYCTPPPAAAQAFPSCVLGSIGTLNDGIKNACLGTHGCTFIDAVSACGGSRVAFSKPALFQDAFHLNQKGYQALFQMPGVQTALSCGVAGATLALARQYIAGDIVTSAGVAGTPSFVVSSSGFLFAGALLAAGVGVLMYRMHVGHDASGADEDDAETGEALPEE